MRIEFELERFLLKKEDERNGRVYMRVYIYIKGILVILLTEKKIINDQCLEGNGLFFLNKKKK